MLHRIGYQGHTTIKSDHTQTSANVTHVSMYQLNSSNVVLGPVYN